MAARLIRTRPDLKVDDIAASAGYQSESSFRKAFHKVMGRLPRDYRQSCLAVLSDQ